MPLPRGPRSSAFAATPKAPPVLAVGWRVVVTSRSNGSGRVMLTDDSGTSTLATVPDGVEVEILAWRPRRGGDTRYRVVPTNGGVEGWLGAASLRTRQAEKVQRRSPPVAASGSPKGAGRVTR